MTDFWPHGLELSDTQSPMEILQGARSDWELESGGLFTLVLQTAKSQSGYDMIIVHARHVPSNRTASLFTVLCRPDAPYPARIQPRDDEVPNLFKKSYYQSSGDLARSMIPAMLRAEGRTVENHWVADTPSELRDKLEEAFNLGIVKSEVLSLAAYSSATDGTERPDIESAEGGPDDPPEGGGQDPG